MIALLSAPAGAQELTRKNYARWRAHLQAKPSELAWLKIGWQPSLWAGVVAAHRARKPILLWVMDGHPLGAT